MRIIMYGKLIYKRKIFQKIVVNIVYMDLYSKVFDYIPKL